MANLQNQQYDAWLHWILTYQCNFNCTYCLSNTFTKAYNINIPALKNTLNATNKIFKISFTGGGEPFLVPNIVEACIELTKKHFISFNTNLTSKKVKQFSKNINPKRVIIIIASCHIKELERTNLIDRYIHNYLLCKDKGFNIISNEVGYPPLIKEVAKYKNFFLKKGINLKFSPYIGKFKGKFYPDSYSEKELKILGLTEKDINKFYQFGKFCNAGYNVGLVNPNGDISYCSKIHKSLGNIYKEIKFNDKLTRCPFKFCECPLNIFDPHLFIKAISEVSSYDSAYNQLFKYIIKENMKNLILNHLTSKNRELIFKLFMKNSLTRNYLLKNWL